MFCTDINSIKDYLSSISNEQYIVIAICVVCVLSLITIMAILITKRIQEDKSARETAKEVRIYKMIETSNQQTLDKISILQKELQSIVKIFHQINYVQEYDMKLAVKKKKISKSKKLKKKITKDMLV